MLHPGLIIKEMWCALPINTISLTVVHGLNQSQLLLAVAQWIEHSYQGAQFIVSGLCMERDVAPW